MGQVRWVEVSGGVKAVSKTPLLFQSYYLKVVKK